MAFGVPYQPGYMPNYYPMGQQMPSAMPDQLAQLRQAAYPQQQPAPGGLFADGEPHQQIIVSDRGKPFFPVAHRADVHIHLPGYIFLRKPGFQPALRKNKSFTFSEISSTFHFITLNFLHVLRSKCGKIFIQQQLRKYKEKNIQKMPWK